MNPISLATPRITFATPATPAAPKGPSTPTPGAPTDGPCLDDYKPGLSAYAKLVPWPLAGGGIGYLAGTSQTAAIIAGGLAGGTLGLMAGAGIGMLIDLLKIGHKSNATGKLAFVGFLAGGVAGGIGGSMLPVAVTAGALGIGGVALGFGIAKALSRGIDKRQASKIDNEARSGNVHLSKLFRQVYDRDAAGSATAERSVRSLEKLETAGWKFGSDENTLSAHVKGSNDWGFTVRAPDGTYQSMPMHALPTLAYLAGVGDAADLDDAGLVDAVKRVASQGRPLSVNDYRNQQAPKPGDETTIRLAETCEALRTGKGAAYIHDGVPMRVDAKDAATLEAALKTVDDLVAKYDQHLAPAFSAGTLDPGSKTQVFEAALKSQYGTDLSRSVPLLVKLTAAGDPKDSLNSRTWQALRTFETLAKGPADRVTLEQAIDDLSALSTRMPRDKALETVSQMRDALSTIEPAKTDRFHDAFMRILRSTGDRADVTARAVQILAGADNDSVELQVGVLEKLAAAASKQTDYQDVILDHATLMAGRSPGEPLARAADRYATLLGGLAEAGHADEAASTYGFIKAALRDGRGVVNDEDGLIAKAVEGGRTLDGDAMRATLVSGGDSHGRDVETIKTRLGAALDARTAERAAHLFCTLPPADMEAQVSALETLAQASKYQDGYKDLLLDYATLNAVRGDDVPLSQALTEYSTLLSGLASMKQAQEAAPTYAFIRTGMANGRFGNATAEQLTEKFFTAALAGADPRRARQSLLQVVPTTDNTVKKDDNVVIIGGVAVPIKR